MISSAEEFVALRSSANRDEYMRAGHEPASDAVWLDVIRRFPGMRVWVAYNKTVPLTILRILADDTDPLVRSAVADKRKLDVALFEKLAVDPDERVRVAIVDNGKTPKEVLLRLRSDSSSVVAAKAAARIAP